MTLLSSEAEGVPGGDVQGNRCLRSGGRRCTRKLPVLSAREAPELGLMRRKGPEAGRAEGDVGLVSAERACTPSAARVGGRAPGRSRLTALPVLVEWSPFLPRLSQWLREDVASHTWDGEATPGLCF